MNSDSHSLTETLDRWKDGTLSDSHLQAWTHTLADPEIRSQLLDAWILDHALPQILSQQAHHIPAPLPTARVLRNSLWKTAGAAAAGLLLGLFSASYVFGKGTLPLRKTIPILSESFESESAPSQTGIASVPNQWSGDISRVTSADQGIQPKSGHRMFQFRQADYEGKRAGFSYTSDLYRIVPIPAGLLDSGDTRVTCESYWTSVPFAEPKRYGASVIVHALDSLPETRHLDSVWNRPHGAPDVSETSGAISASARRSFFLNPNGMTWQKTAVEIQVPKTTRYLLISFHMADHQAGRNPRTSGTTEFPGHFLDDIQVHVIPRSSP